MENLNDPILITGGAGFIGSHLVKKLQSEGYETHVLDNLSAGNIENLKKFENSSNFKFFKKDLLKLESFDLSKYETIFHLAANPDVRASMIEPKKHFEQNVITTLNILDKLKNSSVKDFVFLSTSAVYGDAKKIPTPEDYLLEPISPYGKSKADCEALISSYAQQLGFRAIIFRLANTIGKNSTHGVIYDFINKLKKDPSKLEVLGDGTQNKSYFYISDCLDVIDYGLQKSSNQVNIYNVGSDDKVDVTTIANVIIEQMSLKGKTKIEFTGGVDGGRGWKGDVKEMQLDITKIKSTGWSPKFTSLEAVKKTVEMMLNYE